MAGVRPESASIGEQQQQQQQQQQQPPPPDWPAGAVPFISDCVLAPDIPDDIRQLYWPECEAVSASGTAVSTEVSRNNNSDNNSDIAGAGAGTGTQAEADGKDDIDVIDMQATELGRLAVHERVEIRRIEQREHPAHGQHGLFAQRDIGPRSLIMAYAGVLQLDEDADPASDYSLHLHGPLAVDAADCGNQARFINDFVGVAARPNVAFDAYRDARDRRVRMGVFTLNQTIRRGEELLVTYGKPYWESRGVYHSGPGWDPSWDDEDLPDLRARIEQVRLE